MAYFFEEMPKEQKRIVFLATSAVFVLAAGLIFILIVSYGVGVKNAVREGKFIGLSPESKNIVSFSGEGKIFAKPDVAEINLSVLNEEKTVISARDKNTKAMNKIVGILKSNAVAEKDIKTTFYNIYPRYDWVKDKQTLAGYRVEQTVQVKIRDLEKVGKIIDEAVSAGANEVGQLRFTIDEPEKLKERARDLAIADAKIKAERVAGILGVNLIRVVRFSETGTEPPVMPFYKTMEAGVGGGAESPRIEAGQQEIVSNVSIEWEIN